jgi:predicted Zn-dependent protease with MMP-like domain
MVRLKPREFDQLAERALRRIPLRYRRRLQNLVIVVEPEPPHPELLGLYEGVPRTARSVSDAFVPPDRITLYQGPHQRMARNLPHLERILTDTIWHEIAHHFGLNEREVQSAERRRSRRRRESS